MRDTYHAGGSQTAPRRHPLGRTATLATLFLAACTSDLPTPPLQETRENALPAPGTSSLNHDATGGPELSATTGAVTLSGAGDIAKCPGKAGATANLLATLSGTIFTLGDNVYPDGNAAMFSSCYGPTWGRLRSRTRPSPGNHDYLTAGGAPYFAYFGTMAGPPGRGYYSYNIGAWHIIALNSEVAVGVGSAQELWLRKDLAAHPRRCTLAYWHKPLFSSGQMGSSRGMRHLWQTLQAYGADVVVSGHDHHYERFAPQTALGTADSRTGIREFVVGTGGAPLLPFKTTLANSKFRYNKAHGVLTFRLSETGYTWRFLTIHGAVLDPGSASCH